MRHGRPLWVPSRYQHFHRVRNHRLDQELGRGMDFNYSSLETSLMLKIARPRLRQIERE